VNQLPPSVDLLQRSGYFIFFKDSVDKLDRNGVFAKYTLNLTTIVMASSCI